MQHRKAAVELAGTFSPDQIRLVLLDVEERLFLGYRDDPGRAHDSIVAATAARDRRES